MRPWCKRTLPIVAALTLSMAGTGHAQGMTQPAPMPQTQEEWVQYLSDFTRNADMLTDPRKFLAALNATTEPRFIIAALNAMLDPQLYMQSVASLMDPRAYANYARTMDPRVLADWTQALMDPQFYTALTAVFADPGKIGRWLTSPLDPKVMSVLLNLLNPNVYLRWGMIGLDPRLWNMLSQSMNPNWYGAWFNVMTAPQSYGPNLGVWLQPPYAAPLPPVPPYGPAAIPRP
ncbi:MAG: hypothetical protein NZ524_00065 [Thiobacillaceae bacterium]|nr:hypothetical protein [Thiobacillaceae bacterium]MCX7672041.1 hypothetical protein [Thiobacillaceae bacterium]MDW8323805.1 hypothetical protein [Burkholderiales bacterium]